MTSASRLCATFLLSLLFCGGVFSQQSFQYTTLQVPGRSATFATAINNNGDIVGYSESGGETSGFLYTNGSFQTISPCPYGGTEPTGINDAGVIVGDCNGDPFIYQNGNVSYLSYPKARYTFLMGINNQGVLVGVWENAHIFARSFVYTNGTFATVDGMRLPGGINNSDTVSGIACDNRTEVCNGALYFQKANGWKSHRKVNFPGANGTRLGEINDNGDVVGFAGLSQDFVYNITSKTFTGFEIGNSVSSQALGINNSGEIVGSYSDGTTTYGFYGQLSQ